MNVKTKDEENNTGMEMFFMFEISVDSSEVVTVVAKNVKNALKNLNLEIEDGGSILIKKISSVKVSL